MGMPSVGAGCVLGTGGGAGTVVCTGGAGMGGGGGTLVSVLVGGFIIRISFE